MYKTIFFLSIPIVFLTSSILTAVSFSSRTGAMLWIHWLVLTLQVLYMSFSLVTLHKSKSSKGVKIYSAVAFAFFLVMVLDYFFPFSNISMLIGGRIFSNLSSFYYVIMMCYYFSATIYLLFLEKEGVK